MHPALIILIITSAILALALSVAYVCYKITFSKNDKKSSDPYLILSTDGFKQYEDRMRPMIDKIIATPCEDVYIRSRDGIQLHARYYHVRDGAPVEIQMHGYRGHPFRDFCSGARDACDRGHNLILVDQRTHGGSGGRAITFGIKERYDCLDWIDYTIARFGSDVQIILIGISMGASTVLMATGLGVPKNVKAVMADCPFSSPESIIRKVIGDMGIPHRIAFPFVRLGGILFAGIDVCSASAIDAVKHSVTPTFIIHGMEDGFVPFYMGQQLFDSVACDNKQFLPVPKADHGTSYFCDKDRYLGSLNEFLKPLIDEEK
ncbi:MAG: alpha/beta hydrolase [Clostridia bacterium]|nr:alpha/beta hydrolase [Clostridia bacterium]